METNLVFVIGSLRSGLTLLQRMLSSHPEIFSCPEPHFITPLAHLGYYNMERKILLLSRRNIHSNTFGNVVEKVRFFCDVLLR